MVSPPWPDRHRGGHPANVRVHQRPGNTQRDYREVLTRHYRYRKRAVNGAFEHFAELGRAVRARDDPATGSSRPSQGREDVGMIELPRRSVTRFFIPLIDVLTL